MKTLSDVAIAEHAHAAGFRGQALVTAVAVAIAESGGRPGVPGDVDIQNSKWGPSIGLWQIRSLHADLGTGRQRDAKANLDPRTNAKHAFEIYSEDHNFMPWAAYKYHRHVRFLPRARAAVQHLGSSPGPSPSGKHHSATSGGRIVFSLKELAKFESLMDTSRTRVAHSLRQVQDVAGDLRLTGVHATYLNALFGAVTGPAGLPLVMRHLDWEAHLIQRIRRLAAAVDGDNHRLGLEDMVLYLKNLHGRSGLPEAAVLEALVAGGFRTAAGAPRQRHHDQPRVPALPAPKQMNYGDIVPPGLRRYPNGRLPESKLVAVGQGEKLTAVAAQHFRRMDAAARADGVDLRVNSGYRTYAEQSYYYDLYRNHDGNRAAPPGASNHGWGLSVDLDVRGEADASRWLRNNAARYGFFNDYTPEPWHWTYRPR
ncbi:hypothetical protein Rhe02_65870 [Rhizocola hellebori]|uniref:Peptidase M15B domain-containing protein n=1 Tax=Rhizocola hellebori TaxID=1392758 RepID=A0A8J3QD60_9ACTN|nr:D-alanyl-D-alanine carboxypeptidase family protein [Rhizocola hellebori]GIH08520.1 hypothetical protein Rhe02_65870 [Rhizocola hellebori]